MSNHQCTPKEMVVGFWRDCAVCGKEIEPVFCKDCDGTGAGFTCPDKPGVCRVCEGSGVIEWREATP